MHAQAITTDDLHRTDRQGVRLHLINDQGWTGEQVDAFLATLPAGTEFHSYEEWDNLITAHEQSIAPSFEKLLAQMSELTSIPLDAREQFDAMLRANFTGQINDDEFDAEVDA